MYYWNIPIFVLYITTEWSRFNDHGNVIIDAIFPNCLLKMIELWFIKTPSKFAYPVSGMEDIYGNTNSDAMMERVYVGNYLVVLVSAVRIATGLVTTLSLPTSKDYPSNGLTKPTMKEIQCLDGNEETT